MFLSWRSFQCLSLPLENCLEHNIRLEEQDLPGPLLGSAGGGTFAFGAGEERRMAPSSASPVPALFESMRRQEISLWCCRDALGRDGGGERAQLPPSFSLLPVGMTELGFDLAHLQKSPELP